MYVIKKFPHIKTIDHKYFESGHSESEVDTIHSSVESAKKRTQSIYSPSDWVSVISMARPKQPFHVSRVSHRDFIDSKLMFKSYIKNVKTNTVGKNVNWMKVKWFRIEQGSLIVKYKYDYNEDFQMLNVVHIISVVPQPII